MVLHRPRRAGIALQLPHQTAGVHARYLDGVIAVRRGQSACIRGESHGDGGARERADGGGCCCCGCCLKGGACGDWDDDDDVPPVNDQPRVDDKFDAGERC